MSQPTPKDNSQIKSTLVLYTIFGFFALSSLAGIAYLIYRDLPVNLQADPFPSYPIKGQKVTISEAKTTWRNVSEGDLASEGVLFIPEVELKVAPSSQSCKLICFFVNNEDKIVGDGVTFSVVDGKINGQSEAIATGTAGFTEDAEYRAYRYAKNSFWSFVIQESDTDSQNSKEIARIPIPAKLPESQTN